MVTGDSQEEVLIFRYKQTDKHSITMVLFFNRECNVSVNDTVDSLYNNFMYPEGVKAMGEAVQVGQDHDVCKTLTPLR